MTDSDMVASDWRPFLYFKDKMGGGKRSLPRSSEEINGVTTKQVQTLQFQPSDDEDREVDVNYLFDPRIDATVQRFDIPSITGGVVCFSSAAYRSGHN